MLQEEKRDHCVWSRVDNGEGYRMRWEGSDGQGSEGQVMGLGLISLYERLPSEHFK